jgi:hypothetical protein
MKCEFFDPHPGLAGCSQPIPEPVKKLAAKLDGQTIELNEAVEKVKAVCGGEVKTVEAQMPGDHGFIHLLIGSNSWRVIRYREVTK